MIEETGGARPAADRPAADRTVAVPTDIERDERIRAYRAREQRAAARNMDRYVSRVYGPEWVGRSKR